MDDFRNPMDCINYMRLRVDDSVIYSREKWIVVRNYEEFVNYITNNGLPYLISFDHDLADEHYDPSMYSGNYDDVAKNFKEKTGMDCAKWLVDYCIDRSEKLPKYVIHSMNPVGAQNILSYLNNFKSFQNFEI